MNFIEGYLLGLGMIVFIGPVFFFLLSSTLKAGLIPGLLVALGIIISDVVCVLLCSFGLTSVITHPDAHLWIALIGGALLIGIGLKYLLSKQQIQEERLNLKAHHYPWFFIKGFLVNFVNPFVIMVWIGVIHYAEQQSESNSSVFLCGALLAIFTTDVLKVILAKRIQTYINPKSLQWTYRIFGVILIGFGMRMFLYLFLQ